MKTRITEENGSVMLRYTDEAGRDVERQFIGLPGQYVRELRSDGSITQPCDGLARTGNTLTCYGSLIDTIRKEWRRLQRAIRAEQRTDR